MKSCEAHWEKRLLEVTAEGAASSLSSKDPELHRHLAECGRCAERFSSLTSSARAIDEVLEQMSGGSPSPLFHERLLASARNVGPELERAHLSWWMGLGAAVVIALVAALWPMRPLGLLHDLSPSDRLLAQRGSEIASWRPPTASLLDTAPLPSMPVPRFGGFPMDPYGRPPAAAAEERPQNGEELP